MFRILRFIVLVFCTVEAFPSIKSFFLQPRIDICEGRHKSTIYPSSCENDLVLGTRPDDDCICLRGIWISLDRKCMPKLHFGNKGCMKTSKMQALRYVGTFGVGNDFLVVATVKTNLKSFVWPKVKLLRPVQKVNVAGTTWVLNGRVVHFKKVYYCIETYPYPKADIIREYRIVGFTYVKSECFNVSGNPVAPVRHFYLNNTIADHLQCKQDCRISDSVKIDFISNSSSSNEIDSDEIPQTVKIDLISNSSEDDLNSKKAESLYSTKAPVLNSQDSIKIDLLSNSSEDVIRLNPKIVNSYYSTKTVIWVLPEKNATVLKGQNSTKIDLFSNSSEEVDEPTTISPPSRIIDLISNSSEEDATVSVLIDLASNSSEEITDRPKYVKIDLTSKEVSVSGRKKRKISDSRKISKNAADASDELDVLLDNLRRDHEVVNMVMLRAAVKMAISSPDVEFKGLDIPISSFSILQKLIDVTSNACGDILPKHFLKKAYNFFKVAYDIKGGGMNEVFKTNETDMITQVLENCSASIDTMNFRTKPKCFEQINSFEANQSLIIPIRMTKDHPDFDKHVVLEIIWNMIDLTTAVCIRPFKMSYLIYHLWEQGMEKLFTNHLRLFWQYPFGSQQLYSRLLGPKWKVHATNLEKCVEGAYIRQNKMSRLLRPLWTPGSRKRKHIFAFWRNHVLLYSLDGRHEEELLSNFPMASESKSRTHRKVSSSSVRRERIHPSIRKTHSYSCNKTYYCQSEI